MSQHRSYHAALPVRRYFFVFIYFERVHSPFFRFVAYHT
jgi:hypothetical protein